ncbi:hypothetical protein ZIOFF_003151 [Zingiber officinale]|uniref:Nucleotide-diphospho-sugar transferase domain-containing protein n=1 Tax=Zingiber officinale TaxID=94328 RepID=A0A8J5I8X1_ZINOF|nr:hypothetical protein ZIOFF_003151 [Zingiber officinale]
MVRKLSFCFPPIIDFLDMTRRNKLTNHPVIVLIFVSLTRFHRVDLRLIFDFSAIFLLTVVDLRFLSDFLESNLFVVDLRFLCVIFNLSARSVISLNPNMFVVDLRLICDCSGNNPNLFVNPKLFVVGLRFLCAICDSMHGHLGFMLSCYDAEVSYDGRTDIFLARLFQAQGRRRASESLFLPGSDSYGISFGNCYNHLKARAKEEGGMTTAARPTWAPAKGGNEQGDTQIFGPSQKYSSRDLASHTTLKTRKEGQDTQDELQKRDFREELEERERRHFSSKDKSYTGTRREAEDRIVPRNIDADDSDVDVNDDEDSDSFRTGDGTCRLLDHLVIIALDKKAYIRCISLHTHCFALYTEGMDFSDEKIYMTAGYLSMMWRRIEFLRVILEMGYNFIF